MGLGECQREGRRRCHASGLNAECDVGPGTPSKEVCDAKDNDCNGLIDDGLGEISCGVGACRRVVPTCHSGSAAVCQPGEPSQEFCGDKIDNDCDGQVDEGYADVGQICYAGIGACRRPGKITCDAARMGTECSAVAGQPGSELCGNRIDDDCDGETDTDTPGLAEACSNSLLGDCLRDGRRVCDPKTHQLVCSAVEVKPTPERCDGHDNDCDGTIDNGVVERAPCGQGACAGGIKERRCSFGEWSEWSDCSTAGRTVAELCGNRIDDDCDGIVDSDAARVGDPCENDQVGGCLRRGKLVCGGTDGSLVCSAGKAEPGAEVCNGIDDDCDGAIDEGVTNACGGCGDLPGALGEACGISGGDECAQGTWACVKDVPQGMACVLDAARSEGTACRSDANPCTRDVCHLGACAHPAVADGTGCDDSDACTMSDVCLEGTCAGGAALSCDDANECTEDSCDFKRGCFHTALGGGSRNACGGCEVLPIVPGQECEVPGQIGLCLQGTATCLPDGGIACVQQAFAVKEECNGIDDNCDGVADEGLGETTCGIGACQATVANCQGGAAAACVPHDPQPESCGNMGVDDDCNGVIDDVATLNQDCPAAFGTCIIPGKKRCVGDATVPVCVPIDPRAAEDDDANGVVNYCDHGASIAGGVEEVGTELQAEKRYQEGPGQRLYDLTRTRAVMLPWSRAFDAAVIAPDSPDQSLLIISGMAGEEGGIAALWPKDLSGGGSAMFRSCLVPAADAPRKLLVTGDLADVYASTPRGYVRYPKIASQIPSPLAGAYRCRLQGESIAADVQRRFVVKGSAQTCMLREIVDIELISDRPLMFVGAIVCNLPAASFWKKEAQGVGFDLISQDAAGTLAYEFIPFATAEGAVEDAHVMPLGVRGGGGLFATALVGGKRLAGVCRRDAGGWRCSEETVEGFTKGIAFAGFAGKADGSAPLLLIAEDGAAFEVQVEGWGVRLIPAGGVDPGESGGVRSARLFPQESGRPPTLLLGRDRQITAAAVRPMAAAQASPGASNGTHLVRTIPGESIEPQAEADDVFPGDRFAFGRPHALAALPLKWFGGRDLFAAFEIMSGSRPVGEMGFFYWNANDRPSGALADIRFDGKKGSAELAFADPAGDALSYRATIRAHHGGSLDDWLDGYEGGRLRFSVKGDPSSVGLWPIEIGVEAADQGGMTTTSKAILRRDGMVEAITETAFPNAKP